MTFILLLDMLGTFFFGVSGAMLAVRKDMDLLGVLALSCATAFGGGVLRDLVIGNVPPVAFQHPVYILLAVAAGAAVFFGHPVISRLRRTVAFFDALGLAAFTVIGASIGLAHDVPGWSTVLLGMMTGTAGGAMRDVLGGEIPLVFRREVYATASLAGALAYLGMIHVGAADAAAAAVGAAVVIAIRLPAMHFEWGLPHAKRRAALDAAADMDSEVQSKR